MVGCTGFVTPVFKAKKQRGVSMREREMRQRVEHFLQTRLRNMLLPATLGLGLAISACNSDALNADDGGNQVRDAGPELPTATPDYMAQIPRDAGPVLRYMAQMPADAAPDLGGYVAIYSAPSPRT
jgi:hypothetical protein